MLTPKRVDEIEARIDAVIGAEIRHYESPDVHCRTITIPCRNQADAEMLLCSRADIPELVKTVRELRELVERLKNRNAELETAYRLGHIHASHGPCCTCQRCGKSYGTCRCDLDDAAEEIERLQARVKELEQVCRAEQGGSLC